jgi:hypothetical protein
MGEIIKFIENFKLENHQVFLRVNGQMILKEKQNVRGQTVTYLI